MRGRALARGLARRSWRGSVRKNLVLAFRKRCAPGFLALAQEYPARVQVIDGTRAPDVIAQDMAARVTAHLR